MHLSNWDVYWFTRLEEIKSLLSFNGEPEFVSSFIVCVVILGGCALLSTNDNSEIDSTKLINMLKKFIKPFVLYLCIRVILIFCAVLIPTQKEMAAIIMLPAVINNEELQKVPDNVLKLLNAKLEEWLEDTTTTGNVPVKK